MVGDGNVDCVLCCGGVCLLATCMSVGVKRRNAQGNQAGVGGWGVGGGGGDRRERVEKV